MIPPSPPSAPLHPLSPSLCPPSPRSQVLAAALKGAALHTLSLNLECHSVGDSGAQALAGLKDAPSLHTLILNLNTSSVGDTGAQVCVCPGSPLHAARPAARLWNGSLKGSRVCNSGGGGGSIEPPKTWGGGLGNRAELTGPFLSYYDFCRKCFEALKKAKKYCQIHGK